MSPLWRMLVGVALALPAASVAQETPPPEVPEPLGEVSITVEPVTPRGCKVWGTPGLEEGPIAIELVDGDVDLATGRRACPRTEIGIGGRIGAIIDTPNFYGAVSADGFVFGSYALNSKSELFASFAAVHWEYVQNATLKASNLSLGELTAGGTYVIFDHGPLVMAASARLMLPTSTAGFVRTAGGELGMAATVRHSQRLELHGYAGADLTAGFSLAASQPRVGFLINAGAQYSPTDWFGAVLDLNLHLGSFRTLDSFAPAVALRFRIWRNLGAELAATRSLAGEDRHLIVGMVHVTYRW